jgi:hypothetical protein
MAQLQTLGSVIRWQRFVAFCQPLLKLWVLIRASQAAQTVVINASVNLWLAIALWQHFVRHNSAFQPRYMFVPFERHSTGFKLSRPDADVPVAMPCKFVVAEFIVGTEFNVTFTFSKT